MKGDRNSREYIRRVVFMANLVACSDAYRSLRKALLRLQRRMEIWLKLNNVCIGNYGDIGIWCRLHIRERCRAASYGQQAKGGRDLHCSRPIGDSGASNQLKQSCKQVNWMFCGSINECLDALTYIAYDMIQVRKIDASGDTMSGCSGRTFVSQCGSKIRGSITYTRLSFWDSHLDG